MIEGCEEFDRYHVRYWTGSERTEKWLLGRTTLEDFMEWCEANDSTIVAVTPYPHGSPAAILKAADTLWDAVVESRERRLPSTENNDAKRGE